MNICQSCGKPTLKKVCWRCTLVRPLFTETKAIFHYCYPIDSLVHTAKFQGNIAVLTLLGKLMARHLTIRDVPDVLIPVPLHKNRLRQRGYNQALELAKSIAQHTTLPISTEACLRYRDTVPQYSLSGEQRKNNLHNAFKIQKLKPNWQHVAVVDDVMTTGTTVHEITRILLQAGVGRVDIWCLARA